MSAPLLPHLLQLLHAIQNRLGWDADAKADTLFSQALDSMGMVEFLATLADDLGRTVADLERAANRQFTTVADLAVCLERAGFARRTGDGKRRVVEAHPLDPATPPATGWLLACSAHLPGQRRPSGERDGLLERPLGWLERHAGIQSFGVWEEVDEFTALQECVACCLNQAELTAGEVGALLVTSEAPPVFSGLGARLHASFGLSTLAVPLEIGGACCGFLAALWMGCRLISTVGTVLIVTVESPSRWLEVTPGPAGEAAALFGDGAAACLLGARARGKSPRPVLDVVLHSHGSLGHLIDVTWNPSRRVEVDLQGPPLASWAVSSLGDRVRHLSEKHQRTVDELGCVVIHAGNGRLPPLVAGHLGIAAERVVSTTAQTGNLGSASLPVAWSLSDAPEDREVIWAAVGAGLLSGAALLGCPP